MRYGCMKICLAFLLCLVCFYQPTEAKDSRIVGGSEATRDSWPWIATLIYGTCDTSIETYSDCQSCGGTLIDSKWVLTAAHCLKDDNDMDISVADIDVVFGLHDLKADSGERIKVKTIINHPSYDPESSDNDIALLELETTATPTPIPYYDGSSDLQGRTGTVIGWGNTSATDEIYPDKLQQLDVPIVTNQTCNKAFNDNGIGYTNPITSNMLCAGYPAGGKDSCLGDSGGPLIIENNSSTILAGVVSWGEGCAQEGLYGVYARTSQYKDFISQYVSTPSSVPAQDAPALTVSTSGLDVTASWTSVSGATGYILHYALNPYTGPDSIESVDMETNTSLSTTLWNGASYYVAITAISSTGESGYSNVELFIIDGSTAPQTSCDSDNLVGCSTSNTCIEAGGYPEQSTSLYILPYPIGSSFEVGQGNCTDGSHEKGSDQAYTYDFDTPTDTTIIASRGGVVLATEESYDNGTDTSGHENYVLIKHSDDTVAGYFHLTKNGVLVTVGSSISQGDSIGKSGNSGLSSEPHLHFEVLECRDCDSLPVNFRNTSSHTNGLTEGEFYEALPY